MAYDFKAAREARLREQENKLREEKKKEEEAKKRDNRELEQNQAQEAYSRRAAQTIGDLSDFEKKLKVMRDNDAPQKQEQKLKTLTDEDKIVYFDRSHVPAYYKYALMKRCLENEQVDISKDLSRAAAGEILKISKMEPEALDARTDWKRYRICLVKTDRDPIEEIEKMSIADIAKMKDERKPALILVSPNGEINMAPVTLDEYLKEAKANTLEEAKRCGKTAIYESVYNKDITDKLTYERSNLDVIRDKTKEIESQSRNSKEEFNSRQQNDERQQKTSQKTYDEKKMEEDRDEMRRANDKIMYNDSRLSSRTGVYMDTDLIYNPQAVESQKNIKIEDAKEYAYDKVTDDIESGYFNPNIPNAVAQSINGYTEHLQESIYSNETLSSTMGGKEIFEPDENHNGISDFDEIAENVQYGDGQESIYSSERLTDTMDPAEIYEPDENHNGIPDSQEYGEEDYDFSDSYSYEDDEEMIHEFGPTYGSIWA